VNPLLFVLSFAVILASCEIFTNGVEWLGHRFRLSEGVVGSVLAAVGTAMPETIIPIIAIFLLGGEAGHDVGVGAILGAPFMLSTLALFICGLSVIAFRRRRGRNHLAVDATLVRHDLGFFLVAYALAAGAALLPEEVSWLRYGVAVALLPIYAFYVYRTFSTGETVEVHGLEKLRFHRLMRRDGDPTTLLILFQVFAALAGIIIGANIFVNEVSDLAFLLGVSPLLLSLIVSPVATELPEKFNSIIWIGRGKGNLAIGNITGAMVFQSCIPVFFGMMYTPWHLGGLSLLCVTIALFSAAVLYLRVGGGELHTGALLFGGVLYVAYLATVLATT